jgi:hypothetical protein
MWAFLSARPACAAGGPQETLDALRKQGQHERVLEHLERTRTDPRVAKSFQETIDFEAGSTLIDLARASRSVDDRQRRLAEAKQRLARFIAEHPQHSLAAAAQTQVANVLLESGRIKAAQAAAMGQGSPERKAGMEAARALFREAESAMDAAATRLGEAVKKFGFVNPKDAKKSDERERVRGEQAKAQLSRCWALYEMAQTYDPGTAEHKSGLAKAAEKFLDLYAMHGERLVGLYALVGQARCYRDLGETQKAFSILEGLLAWPDDPAPFRTLRADVLLRILEIAKMPNSGKAKDALRLYVDKWKAGADLSSEQGVAVAYAAAEVALAYARTLNPENAAEKPLREASLRVAREGFALAADSQNPYQAEAKAKLFDPLLAGEARLQREPASFAEAHIRAKAELQQMAEAEAAQRAGRGDRTQQIAAARNAALKYCRLAVKLRAADTPADEINGLRCQMAYLYFKAGDFYEAAVLGEHLARHAGENAAAREGAKVALAAYDALAREAGPEDDRRFENGRLKVLAEFIAKRWPEGPDADEARLVLIQAAIANGQPERAAEILRQMSPNSVRRGDAELCVGQAQWTEYLRLARKPEGQRASQAELQKTADQAQQNLTSGIERVRPAIAAGTPVSPVLAAAALSLAQIYLGGGQADKAVELLDDPKFGPKTLVETKHPAANRGNFAVETYWLALRAYVATQQAEKAERTMQNLENLIQNSGDAEAGKRLVQVYIGLGRDLQDQVEQLRRQGKTEQLKALPQIGELFLEHVKNRKDGNTFRALQWAAEAFYGIGAGFDPGGIRLPEEAKKYYTKAAETYRDMIDRCEADPQFAPQPDSIIAARIRLARCHRRLEQHDKAFELLQRVLKYHPNMVDAQVEAAYIYQSWGDEKPEYYETAVEGRRESSVWGWGDLSKRVQNSTKYRDVFHEARYNLALCRFRQGQVQTDPLRREKLLKTAESDILIVRKISPDMGGKLWYDKYNELIKRIQRLRNQPAAGL